MSTEKTNLWDAQRRMMEEWLSMWQAMYRPPGGREGGESSGSGKKGGGKAPGAVAEGQEAILEFSRHWAQTQEKIARKWWDAMREASWLPAQEERKAAGPSASRGGFWKSWMSTVENFWPAMGGPEKPLDSRLLLNMYADWLSAWYQMWSTGLKRLSEDNPLLSRFISPDAFRNTLDSSLRLFPAENWKAVLDAGQSLLEQNVAFWNDIDLPFDEMAAFWDRMLTRFTPLEETQLFTLGAQINQYVEALFNPFFAISGSPQMIQIVKQGRIVQFHYFSFLIKNAELRGKVLEASLAVWPETFKGLLEEMEKEKTIKLDGDFYRLFVAGLEERVGKLMKSEEYTRIQNELSEIGVRLKAALDDWFELLLSGLPVLTRSDEDDIAKELEALRVKVRRLSQEQKKEPREKLVKPETAN